MTVTTDEFGKQNMFASEPKIYISDADAIKYGMMTHNERAELANSRWKHARIHCRHRVLRCHW